MAAPELNASEILAALLPIVGGGGVVSVLVAYFAYRAEVAKGRRGQPEKGHVGIAALLADSASMESFTLSIDRLALAMDKISLLSAETKHDVLAIANEFIDEVRKLRRAVEDKR